MSISWEEKYFNDDSIIEQSSAMIRRKDGSLTNGIVIVVTTRKGVDAVEVLLEYTELEKALSELREDRSTGLIEYT